METTQHILVDCGFTRSLWNGIISKLHLNLHWETGTFVENVYTWQKECCSFPYLPAFFSWLIWGVRNRAIFEEERPCLRASFHLAMKVIKDYMHELVGKRNRDRCTFTFDCQKPVGFFDGSSIDGYCAIGGVIYINMGHYITLIMDVGIGTNTKAELLDSWCILTVARDMGLRELAIFGDSRVTIKWALQEFQLQVMELQHWCIRTQDRIYEFHDIWFEHIFWEHNGLADKLSKEAHGMAEGVVF